ncbi:small ribosomal subunit protein mS39 [Bacillus rossius redtenbacheri]|uniref:small ribosomal subunit protein mS39 n=1 Tax=Bacillus rossius redtenbacheri TaxID=93214 RepID=UPI002FDE2907
MNSLKKCYCKFGEHRLKVLKTALSRQSTASAPVEEIKIPEKIKRGPTDILRALSSTVGRDYTAAHYKYHDDPYLIPTSNISKRTFALAKESGRKAAFWIRQENPFLFQHREADPPIQAFYPKPVFDENSDVSEEILLRCIADVCVSDALTVYELLCKKGIDVSEQAKLSLLQLACYHNCEDSLREDLFEERWFKQGTQKKAQHRKTWKDNGLAETIFNSLQEKKPEAYCAVIQGMVRFFQVDRAWQLYEETQAKGIPVTTETYNSLISVANYLREGNDLRWKLIEELLTAMARQGLAPDVSTLNSVLEAVSSMGMYWQAKTYALQAVKEFTSLGIEPSLASYYFLLVIFCKERGPVSNILAEIMEHIRGRAFTIRDAKDTHFFVTAMEMCRRHLQDKDLAWQVDALLHTANNYDLIGDSYKESVYYRHFFALLCSMEPLDVFMDFYNKMVPNIYVPEPGIMEEVIKAVDMNGAMEHLPRLWSDMVMFDHTDRENLLVAVLGAMIRNQPAQDSDLAAQFAGVAWAVWLKLVDHDEERYRQLRATGAMLGDVMVLLLRAGRFADACAVLGKLDRDQHAVVGVPAVAALQLFLDACVQQKDAQQAIACVRYCADAGYPEAGQLAQSLQGSLPLSAGQVDKLASIVGREAVGLSHEAAS